MKFNSTNDYFVISGEIFFSGDILELNKLFQSKNINILEGPWSISFPELKEIRIKFLDPEFYLEGDSASLIDIENDLIQFNEFMTNINLNYEVTVYNETTNEIIIETNKD